MKRPWLAASILTTILIIFRVATASNIDFVNVSPVVAALFLGAAFWKTNKWMLPAAAVAWIVSSPLVSAIQGYSAFNLATLWTVTTLAVVVFLGLKFKASTPFKLIGGTILAATVFYLITNSISFCTNPIYPKTLEGYTQCMWSGSIISTTPTWVFFRNSLVSNGLASTLFLLTMSVPAINKASNFKLSLSPS